MDVLKVMQRVIVTLDYTADGDEDSIAYRDKKDLTEARAAVAELIEALQAMLEFPNTGPSHTLARAALAKASP